MKIKIVFGAPCSGKTRYVRNHIGESDMVYDYDALLFALTGRTEHVTKKHAAHIPIVQLRRVLVDLAQAERQIQTFWMICSWPNYYTLNSVSGLQHEKIYIAATKEQCLDHLANDQSRPDKEAWKAVIDDWYQQYGKYPERWKAEDGVQIVQSGLQSSL